MRLSPGQDFGTVNATLQMIQKPLENKRTMFPRFDFPSNDRLLDCRAKARPRGRTGAPFQALPGHRPPEHRQRGDIASVCQMANAEGEALPTAR
jgi:hypothetical protein